jgi:TonB family protein
MTHYKYYVTSLVIHVVVLILFGMYFDESSQLKKYGNTQAKAVSAFIYQGALSQSASVKDQEKVKSNQTKEPIIKKTKSLQALKIKENSLEKKVQQSSSSQSSVSQGEATSTLIALLHDAIQRKQQYPASASEMQRQGRVTVVFQLHQGGHISHLRMLKSSGTSSLDQAALQAVNDAAPFQELVAYIKQPEEYQIDIVFELE